MSTNFSRPIPSDLYADTLQNINTMFNDLARGLDPDTTGDHTVMPVGCIRWSSNSKRWERFNGSSFTELTDKFSISVLAADTAVRSNHLEGGAANRIPFQTGEGATGFVPAPVGTSVVLMYTTNNVIEWVPFGSISAGTATTATNLSGGFIQTGANTQTVGSATDSNAVINGSSSTSSVITFKRAGATLGGALKMGVDTDNTFKIGGGTDGVNIYRMTIDSTGNVLFRGNVTGFSDERLKTDWKRLRTGVLNALVNVKAGTYKRTDWPEHSPRQCGVSAQDLEAIIPEVISRDYRGTLSVAYGQAALTLVVEIARELVVMRAETASLRAELEALKQRLSGGGA